MNYHKKLIELIESNKENLEWELGIFKSTIKSEVQLPNVGDIDILINATNIYSRNREKVIIEVKGHRGLIQHYLRKQLPKYQQKFPDARQFIAYGTFEKELDFKKITFEEFK